MSGKSFLSLTRFLFIPFKENKKHKLVFVSCLCYVIVINKNINLSYELSINVITLRLVDIHAAYNCTLYQNHMQIFYISMPVNSYRIYNLQQLYLIKANICNVTVKNSHNDLNCAYIYYLSK